MFALRFLFLAFLVAYSWSMGKIPSGQLNAFGTVVALSFFFAAPALYLLPTYEAWRKKHSNLAAIALVNAFLGWSLVGWVVALVWAFKRQEITHDSESAAAVAKETSSGTRACPFCAEEIKAQAVKCKHCGSEVAAASAA